MENCGNLSTVSIYICIHLSIHISIYRFIYWSIFRALELRHLLRCQSVNDVTAATQPLTVTLVSVVLVSHGCFSVTVQVSGEDEGLEHNRVQCFALIFFVWSLRSESGTWFSESACGESVSCMQLNRFTSAVWDGFFKKKRSGWGGCSASFFSCCSEPVSTDTRHFLWFCIHCFSFDLVKLYLYSAPLQITKCFKTFLMMEYVFVYFEPFLCFLSCWFALYGDMYSNLNEGLVQCYAPFSLFA